MNEFASDGFGPRNEEERVIYAEESFRVDVQTTLNTLMIAKGLTEADLMKRAGVGDVFSDEAELTMRDLAKVLYAMGEVPTLTTTPITPEPPQTVENDGDTKRREPGCECHLEEGDSPCPVHDSTAMREIREAVKPHIGDQRDASQSKLAAVLAKVPDVPASPGDELTTSQTEIDQYTDAQCIRDNQNEAHRQFERANRLEHELEAAEARAKKAEAMSVAARVALKEDGEMEEKLAKADAKIEELETKLDAAEARIAMLEGNSRVAVKESFDRALGKKDAETELAALREKDSK